MSWKTRLSIVLLALWPMAGLAGGQATIQAGKQGEGSVLEFSWKDQDTLRMQVNAQPGYFIARDGKAYSVSMQNGKPMVMDMQAMMKAMRAVGGQQQGVPAPEFGKSGSFEATGRSETVAGIAGEVYRVEWEQPNGTRQVQDTVLTDDPTVVEMTRAYMGSLNAMFSGEKADSFQNEMPAGKKGLLRIGTSFRVESISAETPPDSHFKLPAKPMDMQHLMRGNN